MKLNKPHTLKEVADIIKAKYSGNDEFPVNGINEIHMVEAGDLTFVDFEKYYDKALSSAATTIIINKDVPAPAGKALIFSDDPFRDYNFLSRYFQPAATPPNDKFTLGDDSRIGPGTKVFPGAVIGNHVRVGNNCIIYPNVVIYDRALIGDNVIIHAGSVIGGDAFYYKRRPEFYDKMNSCGRVVLEDFVEIGCNCTIDRGVSGDTLIGRGTKIDNLVHIGHDTKVGQNCIFAAQVGVAGVTVIEDNVILWGQVGVTKDIVIGKGAVVSAQSGVSKSLEGGRSYFGSPAKEFRKAMKELAMIARLPDVSRESKSEKL